MFISEYFEPEFELFTIRKGQHHSTHQFRLWSRNTLSYYAKFDQSARYESAEIQSLWETNKLLGFSDCVSKYQINMARFGWRWADDHIEIYVHASVDGQVLIQKIGETCINKHDFYQIKIREDEFEFIFNNQSLQIPRRSDEVSPEYYLLYPYFGVDHKAPHDIHIEIKMLN